MTNRLAATVVLMVATFMDLMDSTITNVALPAISATLEATPAQLEWTLAGYVIAFATLLITGGRLGDIFGRRSIFLIGVIGFTVASGLASLAWSGDMLVTTRVVQGAFAGIMVPQVLSSVQVMFAPEERGPIFGVVGALSAIGAIAGLLLGGWLVTADVLGTGWRSIFLINVPVGILLVAATVLFVPNSRSEHPVGLDLAGVALGALAVFLVVFPLTDGANSPRTAPRSCPCRCSRIGGSPADCSCRWSHRWGTAATRSCFCSTCRRLSASQHSRQDSHCSPLESAR